MLKGFSEKQPDMNELLKMASQFENQAYASAKNKVIFLLVRTIVF